MNREHPHNCSSLLTRATSRLRSLAWPIAGVLIAALVAVPIVVILSSVGADSDGVWEHLTQTVLPDYIKNTILLACGVSVCTLVVGVATAWTVTMCRFPGHKFFRWALLLPLAIPTYLTAYAYSDLLQFSGPVQTGLRDTFGWTRQDYWFPEIRSLSGAIGLLSLGLYPYVYLAARTAFLEQSVCVLEVSRTLGLGPWRCFLRVALPLARPSLIAGLSLALMETVAEFGAVDYCAVDTFATGIYRTWMSRGSLTAAAQLSACLLGLVGLLIGLEVFARRGARFHHTTQRYRVLPAWQLRGWKTLLAVTGCSMTVLLGFCVPTGLFAWMTWQGGDMRVREMFFELGRNSFLLAAAASALAALLAMLVAYGRRLHPTRITRFAARLSGIGYAIPGGVIAIGILIPITWLDHRINDLTGWLFGMTPGLLLSGTIAAVILGYQTRFLAVSLNLIEAGLTRIRPSLDDAARTLGASPGRMLGVVHVPLLRGTILAAVLLVFVDVVKELPATLILRPFNFETLAVRVYQLASDERLAEASTGALAIILVGLLPVTLLSRLLNESRPGTSFSEETLIP